VADSSQAAFLSLSETFAEREIISVAEELSAVMESDASLLIVVPEELLSTDCSVPDCAHPARQNKISIVEIMTAIDFVFI